VMKFQVRRWVCTDGKENGRCGLQTAVRKGRPMNGDRDGGTV
jgi:hypothetical protein